MQIKSLVAALTIAGLAAAASAAPLTYDVARTIGGATVTGTITTDGTIGNLATTNITAWSLKFSFDSSSLDITQANSQFAVSGSALTADIDSVDFDFAAASGFFLFQSPTFGTGNNFWCVNAVNSSCSQNAISTEQLRFNGANAQARQGVVEMAARGTAVPEPATLALTGLALLAAAVVRRRG